MQWTSNLRNHPDQALRVEPHHYVEVHVLARRTVKHLARALLKDCKKERLDSQLAGTLLVRIQLTEPLELAELFEEFREAHSAAQSA